MSIEMDQFSQSEHIVTEPDCYFIMEHDIHWLNEDTYLPKRQRKPFMSYMKSLKHTLTNTEWVNTIPCSHQMVNEWRIGLIKAYLSLFSDELHENAMGSKGLTQNNILTKCMCPHFCQHKYGNFT